jgi:nucleoid DNA-binding protein
VKLPLIALLLCLLSAQSYAQSDRGLAKTIAKDLQINQEQVFQIIKSFKKEVIKSLREDDVVRLQGLGQFYVEQQPARAGNPRTGEMEPVPAKKYLRFKPSKVGNQSLNSLDKRKD